MSEEKNNKEKKEPETKSTEYELAKKTSGFEQLKQEIQAGMEGKNRGLPMGFPRLSRFVGIRKKIYTLVFGATGSGKSALVHSAFILNPFEHWYQHLRHTGMKLKIPLFSMERSRSYTLAKWTSRRIFLDHQKLIPIAKIMGWWDDKKLTHDEHDLILSYENYFGELLEVVDFIEGSQNPTAVFKYIKQFAKDRGDIEPVTEHRDVYLPKYENEIVIPVFDHMGLTRTDSISKSKKEAIDKVSEYFQHARDFYGYSPVMVAQLNRDASNPMFSKLDSFEPNIDQIKETGRPAEDSDVTLSLFDPLRFKTNDPSGYKVEQFRDMSTGAKYFRSLKILKNSYGEDDIRLGLAFHGATGTFMELPKAKDMDGFDYNSLFTGNYFWNQ